jgi:solute carrier family 24 (sodium/potassium/calcium exchanger), member 6
VKANCPDEEAGLISYLQLYYCSLRHAQPVAFVILVIWTGLLFSTIGIAASDFLCINLSTISSILGMSQSLAGVTFLAFGNGSPDVFSTFAAMSSHSGSLAVGELIGAASFITAVVAGSMALVRPFKVARRSFVRDVSFFIIAACFSMLFLADGRLHTWECACMVGFYVFYVAFVVTWHWWLTRRRRRRLRKAAARLHHHIPRTQELDVQVEEEDEEATPGETSRLLRSISEDDLAGLEGSVTPAWKQQDDFDEDDQQRDRYLAELRSNMRVSRPPRGERRNTITPIRPSLVGALEFRSVLHSLEKRSTYAPPINLRRYSDDPSTVLSQLDGPDLENAPNRSQSQHQGQQNGLRAPYNISGRGRAVSANDAAGLKVPQPALRGGDVTTDPVLHMSSSLLEELSQASTTSGLSPVLGSPRLFISPPASSQASRDHSMAPPQTRLPDRLAPPDASFHRPDYEEQHHDRSLTPNISPSGSPKPNVPRISIPQSSPTRSPPSSMFPTYADTPSHLTPASSRPPSIRLPPPSLSPESSHHLPYDLQQYEDDDETELRKFRWWPYRYLPAPQVIAGTLFPTVYTWSGKSIWDKLLGIVTVPSVFLLTITLPIVEAEEKENPDEAVSGVLTPQGGSRSRAGSLAQLIAGGADDPAQYRSSEAPSSPHKHASLQAHLENGTAKPKDERADPKEWNRWLVCVQLFTAPLFTIMIIWANLDGDHDMKSFFWFILCSLLFSLICLLILLATTAPDHPPEYRSLLCFLGFAVAVAWISTIANEVVGVLKAFGVILGISDAILGLTIFAVGNSLGDLVADITVAKLGYPVMALSACFGGPMLNILLGIGVSGLYITIRHSAKSHHKHPDRPIKYKPYEIEVSTTLLISGITLLVTLVGLLIVVPLNGWKMDRKIGWGLICLWTLSTIGNVIVEVLGWGGDLAMLNV